MLALTHIDEFLETAHRDSALKNRLLLWAFVVLVSPTAVLVSLGAPEKPAYIIMASLFLPLYLGVYLLRRRQTARNGTDTHLRGRIAGATLPDIAAYDSPVRVPALVGHEAVDAASRRGRKADPEHLAVLGRGVGVWNSWVREHSGIRVNLTGANFRGANLAGAYLTGASLYRADFEGANLRSSFMTNADLVGATLKGANLMSSNLVGADLRSADLSGASLSWADLRSADLSGSDLSEADLRRANLADSILERARVGYTLFGDIDLSEVKGLESVRHLGASTIGIDTIYRSNGRIPESFLRGADVPDSFIAFVKSLAVHPIHFYSCFISYSTQDQAFADRLYADLQNKGVRCWFAPHDVQGGKKLHEQIDEAIRMHDKMLLILSPYSMESDWVKTEIAKARKREEREQRRVLFPIRLAPIETLRDWECFDADLGKDSAREILQYFIPDFSHWKDHDSYQEAFQRLISDLKASDAKQK